MDGTVISMLHFNYSFNPWYDKCNNTWTASGSPSVSSTNAKFAPSAMQINSGFIYCNNTLKLGGQDFTIDLWASITSGEYILDMARSGSQGSRIFLCAGRCYADSSFSFTNSNPSEMNHYALVYNNSTQKITTYLNGVSMGTMNCNFTSEITIPVFRLGQSTYSETSQGTIDAFRITNGVQRWTENFTPPTKDDYEGGGADMSNSINKGKTKALLHFNTSTTADVYNNSWSVYGSPSIATQGNGDFTKSLYLNGSSCIVANHQEVFNLSGEFTLDAWVYPTEWRDNNYSVYNFPVFSRWSHGSDTLYFVDIVKDGCLRFYYEISDTPHIVTTSTGMVPLNKWTHIAVTRDSENNLRLFVNGVCVVLTTCVGNFISTESKFNMTIGASSNKIAFAAGYIAKWRVSGNCIWTGDFVPPSGSDYNDRNNSAVCFRFNDTEIHDLAGNEWNLYGTPTVDSSNARWSYALNLDANSYLVSNKPIQVGPSFTVEAYYTPTQFTNEWPMIFCAASALNTEKNRIFMGGRASDGNVGYDNNGNACTHFSCTFAAGTHYHMAYCYDATTSTLRVFVNGVVKYTGTVTIYDVARYWTIGAQKANTYKFVGSIDYFEITPGICKWTENFEVDQHPKSRTTIDLETIPITIVSSYGTDPNNLTQTFRTETYTVTQDNYNSYSTDISKLVERQESDLKAYLSHIDRCLLNFNTNATTDEYGNTWTTVGSPTVSETNAKFGKALQLNGSSCLCSSEPIELGGQDFTISFWCYVSSNTGNFGSCFSMSNDDWWIDFGRWKTENNLYISVKDGDNHPFTTAALNTLHHVAIVYIHSTGTWNFFIDGKLLESYVCSMPVQYFWNLEIGRTAGKYYLNGSIDDFQIINGLARWTTNFTPPTIPSTFNNNVKLPATMTGSFTVGSNTFYWQGTFSNDSEYVARYILKYGTTNGSYTTQFSSLTTTFTASNVSSSYTTLTNNMNTQVAALESSLSPGVKVLMHFNDSTTADACSNNTWAVAKGTCSVAATNAKFGNALQLNQSCIYSTNQIYIGGDDFTIDFWCYLNSSAYKYPGLFALRPNTGLTQAHAAGCMILERYTDQDKLIFDLIDMDGSWRLSNDNTDLNCTGIQNGLHHFAVVYTWSNKTFKFYKDGVCTYTKDSTTISGGLRHVYIGTNAFNESSYPPMIGTIDEFRIHTGVALWSGNFTPPTMAGNTTFNIPLPAAITGSHAATNGTTYYYKAEFYNTGDTTANFKIIWGTSTSYGQTYHTSANTTFTKDNYLNAPGTLTTAANTQISNLKTYLNTLVGTVTAPAADTGTVTTDATYYWKCTYTVSGLGITATTATVTSTLVFGTSTSYGTTWVNTKTQSVTVSNRTNFSVAANKDALVAELTEYLTPGVKSLLSFDSAATTDSVGKLTWTAVGSPTVNTTNARFTKGLILNGSSYIKSTTGIVLGGRDFTVDCWFYSDAQSTGNDFYMIFCGHKGSDTEYKNTDNHFGTFYGNYNYRIAGNPFTWVSSSGRYSDLANSKHVHVAFVYQHATHTTKIYMNGKEISPGTNSDTSVPVSKFHTIAIGYSPLGQYHLNTSVYGNYFKGTIDDFKITNGVALWKANFTPPTRASNTSFNVPLPVEITGTHVATNGITYYYKATFSNSSDTAATVTLVWGKDTNYGQTYYNQATTFTASNYLTAPTTLTSTANTQINNLKNYMNTLIDTVTVPTDTDHTIVATNGLTYHYKTNYTGGNTSITATSCTLTATTVWGLTTSYGQTYKTDNLPVTISNLKTAVSTISSTGSAQQTNLKSYLNTLIGTVTLPSVTTGSFVKDGTTYYYKLNYTGGNSSITATSCTVTTQCLWGTSTSYGQTFATDSVTITPSTYAAYAQSTYTTKANTWLTALQAALTPGIKHLMHFDEDINADACGAPWTKVGSPTQPTTAKFGAKSSCYATNSSYLMTRVAIFENKNFTFDWWEYMPSSVIGTGIVTYQMINTSGTGTQHTNGIELMYYDDRTEPQFWLGQNNGSGWILSNQKLGANRITDQWVHRAFVRDGNNLKCFENGTLVNTVSWDKYIYGDYYSNFYIGNFARANRPTKGYLDEVRITKGIAIWTENFTVPDRAGDPNIFVALPATMSGTHVAKNGNTYKYKVEFSTDSNTVGKYVTTWGLTDYSQTYSTKTTTFTATTYQTSQATMKSNANTEINKLKNFLDTLIGIVSPPAAETGTITIGDKTWYYKTVYTGGEPGTNIARVGCTLHAKTLFDSDTSYRNAFMDESHIVRISNLSTYVEDIKAFKPGQIEKLTEYLTPSVKSLMKFDTDTVTDLISDNTWESAGTVEIGTDGAKFGKALKTTANSGYIDMSSGIGLGGQDFTIDCWARINCGDSTSARVFEIDTKRLTNTYENRLTLLFRGCLCLVGAVSEYGTQSGDGKLHHHAVVYKDGVTTYYLDGQYCGQTTLHIPYRFCYPALGFDAYLGKSNQWDTYYDEFKITNGIALWSGNFTPPTIESNTSFNVPLPNQNTTNSVEAVNGTTYYYRVDYENVTATTAKYTLIWGTSTSYGQTYKTETFTFTEEDYLDAPTTLTNAAVESVRNMKSYLNTLIGEVKPPTDTDHTVVATNGITYHYKTNYTGGNTSITATEGTLTATTVWGLDTKYGQTYKTDNLVLNPTNAKTSPTTIQSTGASQQTALKAYLNTLIGTVTPPAQTTGNFKIADTTYYWKTTHTGSNTSITATSCKVTTQTIWGQTTSYGQLIEAVDTTVVPTNYANRNSIFTSIATTQLNNLKSDLALGVKVLLHFDTDLVTDDSGMTWKLKDTPIKDNTRHKFGSSCLFTNNQNYGIQSDRPILLEDKNFTVDWWEFIPSSVTTMTGEILSFEGGLGVGPQKQCIEVVYYRNVKTPSCWLGYGNNGGWIKGSQVIGSKIRDRWVHRALVRTGPNLLAFEEGVLFNTIPLSTNWYFSMNYCRMQVGFCSVDSSRFFPGCLDEVRVVRGYALWTENFTPGTMPTVLEKMVLLPAQIIGEFTATNGIKYYYKTTFSNDSNIIGRYTTVWGTSTSYGQTYSNKTTTFTDSNYSNSQVLLEESANVEINNLKTYLNTLIGTVTTPATISDTYTAANGTTYFYKTTFTGSSSSVTATSCKISCTTTWSDTTSYDQTYTTGDVTITASNYQNRNTLTGNLSSGQITNLKKYLDTLVGKFNPPVAESGDFTPTTNKIKYYWKTTYTGGNTSITATTATLTATTVWGNSTSYGQTYATETIDVTVANTKTAASTIKTKGATQQTNLKAYLPTLIGIVTPPTASNGSFVIDNTTYNYTVAHSGSNSDITATSCNVTTQITWYPGTNTDLTQVFKREVLNIVPSNYPTYSTTLTNKVTPFLNELKEALTPGIKSVLHFEESVNKDDSGKTWLIVGSPELSSEQAKFGSKSIKCGADRSMIKLRAMLFENKNWTIDFWEYFPTAIGNGIIKMQLVAIDYDDGRDANMLSTLYYTGKTDPVFYVGKQDRRNGWDYGISNTSMGVRMFDRWTHYALIREGNQIKAYQDGILQSTVDFNTYLKDDYSLFTFIGNYILDNRPHKGYIDEVRLIKGYALWTENFTIPDKPGDANTAVALPTTISGTHTAKNGVTYYYKTSFSTDSASVGRYITVWGKTDSYGQTYSNKTITFTTTNFMTSQATLKSNANTEINNLKNYLDTLIDIVTAPANTTHTYKATTSGITYNYRKAYSGGNTSITAKTCTMGVNVNWSTDTSYSKAYGSDSVSVTIDNLTTAHSTLTTKTNTIETNLKAYLNTLIGPITLPSTKTEIYTSKSGKKFYLRSQYSKKSTTDTQCVVTYATDWGFTNSYGTAYSSKEHTITSSNYQSRDTDLSNKSQTEFNSCHSLFALWDLVLPTNTSEDWTSLGEEPYKIKVTFTQGVTSDTTNTVNYTVSYIKKTNPEVAFYSGSETFNSSNYSNYKNILATTTAGVVEDLKYWINHPDINLPEDIDEVIKFDEHWNFHTQIQFTKGSTVNVAIIKCFIDGVQFGSTITNEYYTMESADAELPAIKQTIYNNVNRIVKTAPVCKNTDYTVGGMTFRCRNVYGKPADSRSTTIYVKTDEDKTNIRSGHRNIDIVNLEADLAKMKQEGEALLQQSLNVVRMAPDSFSEVVTYGGFSFHIGVSFSKNFNTTNYSITLKLDGDTYSTTNFTYTITDMSTFLENATNLVNALKSILSTVPRNSYEVFTIRRYNWGMSMMYEKAANSHNVKKWFILDGYQYGEAQNVNFDVTNISALSAYLVNLRDDLKALLTSNGAPEDIVRYRTIRNVEFGILVTFSKEAGESIIYISYFALNRFISPKINELPYNTSIKITDIVGVYVTEEIIQETIDLLVEFTYEAAEPAAIMVWGINHIPDESA